MLAGKTKTKNKQQKKPGLKKRRPLIGVNPKDIIAGIRCCYVNTFHKAMFILVIVSVAALFLEISWGAKYSPDVRYEAGEGTIELLSAANLKTRGLNNYLKPIRGKNIFVSSPTKVSRKKLPDEKPLSQIITKYRVVGILWDESSRAYIEDTKARKTFSVQEGSEFDGIIVDQIKSGSVMFSRAEETVELFL